MGAGNHPRSRKGQERGPRHGGKSLALVAVAVPSSSSGACEVALVAAGVVAWR